MSHDNEYLAADTDVLVAAALLSHYQYGDASNDNNVAVQCDLLTEDGGHEIDPTRLAYKDRIRWHLKEFCYKTSSHGIPMLGQAPNALYRCSWIVLLCTCAAMFIFQAVNVVAKYNRMEKITDIQLKFDTAPFPAITICNLNPYMNHKMKAVEKIQQIIDVYNRAMNDAGSKNRETEVEEEEEGYEEEEEKKRLRRESGHGLFEPARSVCDCPEDDQCTGDKKMPPEDAEEDSEMCICSFDRDSEDLWPCVAEPDWTNTTCHECSDNGQCVRASGKRENMKESCICADLIDLKDFCIKHDPRVVMLNVWEFYNGIKTGVVSEEMLEALGFEGITDEVAIVTKAKENIIFAMSELEEAMRRNLSIEKHVLLQKCSFNGQACDIEKDFLIVSDPTFGNCYTYNHNRSDIKASIRAGPSYGLRVLVFVNASDYLPTTEAVGVRLTIHGKDEFPFPKQMTRLPAPYGDCVSDGKTSNYVYQDYVYSTEGCYRTCFQDMVVQDCECGDPRFPVLGNASHCKVFDPKARKCLEQRTKELGNIHASFRCTCQQPCKQSVYTVSYSEAIWPSQALNITLGHCKLSPEECNEHYQENGAMVEVFYEALNFELLSESEAYGVVKMLADFGGQLGLWSGVSFITCCEFVCLAAEILYMVIMHHYTSYKRNKWLRQREKEPW